MAKIAKTASKNNPFQRKKGIIGKLFHGKTVKPVKFMDRDRGLSYISAQSEDGKVVEDASGNPIKWDAI